jgi:hypothetical protein
MCSGHLHYIRLLATEIVKFLGLGTQTRPKTAAALMMMLRMMLGRVLVFFDKTRSVTVLDPPHACWLEANQVCVRFNITVSLRESPFTYKLLLSYHHNTASYHNIVGGEDGVIEISAGCTNHPNSGATESPANMNLSDGNMITAAAAAAAAAGARTKFRHDQIVNEIFATEQYYIAQLMLVQDRFIFPFRRGSLLSHTNTLKQIFANFEEILALNTELLHLMRTVGIASAFMRVGPYFKLYALYADNFEAALCVLDNELKRSSKLAAFVHTEAKRPEFGMLRLESLLILPIQRVPRYELLLQSLLRATPQQASAEYVLLCEVVGMVGEINGHINDHIRQKETAHKIVQMQQRLIGGEGRLVSPGRSLVREGAMYKICSDGVVRIRQCYLCSDTFVYAKPGKLQQRGSLHFRKSIELHKTAIQCAVIAELDRLPVLVLACDQGGTPITFYGRTPAETMVWYAAIRETIRSAKSIHGALLRRKASVHQAPTSRAAAAGHAHSVHSFGGMSTMASPGVTSSPTVAARVAVGNNVMQTPHPPSSAPPVGRSNKARSSAMCTIL